MPFNTNATAAMKRRPQVLVALLWRIGHQPAWSARLVVLKIIVLPSVRQVKKVLDKEEGRGPNYVSRFGMGKSGRSLLPLSPTSSNYGLWRHTPRPVAAMCVHCGAPRVHSAAGRSVRRENKRKEKGSKRQQKRTMTGTLSASWSWDLYYFEGWRLAAGGWWRLAAVGGW